MDPKPVAFEIAGREAFKLAVQDAGPVLFEPIMNVRIVVPDANMGDRSAAGICQPHALTRKLFR